MALAEDSRTPRERRREEMRTKLLAAIEQLLEDGAELPDITVERLVAAASTSRSTFYLYFEDKGDLLRVWLMEVNRELEQAARGWWAIDGTSTREDLRAVQEQVFAVYRPHTALMAATHDTAAWDPAVRDAITVEQDRNVERLRRHIADGQARGFVAPELDPLMTARWITTMTERGVHVLVREAAAADVPAWVDTYTDVVWNALYAPVRQIEAASSPPSMT